MLWPCIYESTSSHKNKNFLYHIHSLLSLENIEFLVCFPSESIVNVFLGLATIVRLLPWTLLFLSLLLCKLVCIVSIRPWQKLISSHFLLVFFWYDPAFGFISLLLPRLPKLPSQCYSNQPDNWGNLGSDKYNLRLYCCKVHKGGKWSKTCIDWLRKRATCEKHVDWFRRTLWGLHMNPKESSE